MKILRFARELKNGTRVTELIVLLSIVMTDLSGCGIHYVKQQASESRVTIIALAGKNLNHFKSAAHPLLVNIYQLKSLDQLRLLPKQLEFSELKRLLDEKIQHLSVNSQTLLPDSAKKLQLSMQKNCRYLLILAGYYDLAKLDDYMAIYPIAVYRRSMLRIEYGKPINPEIYIRFGGRKII